MHSLCLINQVGYCLSFFIRHAYLANMFDERTSINSINGSSTCYAKTTLLCSIENGPPKSQIQATTHDRCLTKWNKYKRLPMNSHSWQMPSMGVHEQISDRWTRWVCSGNQCHKGECHCKPSKSWCRGGLGGLACNTSGTKDSKSGPAGHAPGPTCNLQQPPGTAVDLAAPGHLLPLDPMGVLGLLLGPIGLGALERTSPE